MATATSREISTVKPAGGGDYTTLATWWAAKKGSATVAAHAECYGGGDLQPVSLASPSYTPTADYYTRIYSAAGERHDGTGGGAYMDVTDTNGIAPDHDRIHVDGLRFVLYGATTETRGIFATNRELLEIDSCLFDIQDATNSTWATRLAANAAGSHDLGSIRNCIVYGNSKAIARGFLTGSAGGAGVSLSHVLQNNTVANAAIGFWFLQGASTSIVATSTNNIAAGVTTCYRQSSTPTVTQTYCLASDATATLWGGAGNVNSEAAADVFVSPASDLNLKAASPAISTGVNLYSTFTEDAIGTARRSEAAWDMGALTTAVASYCLYRGVGGISNVDFSAPVGTVSGPASSKTFTALGHVANTRYTYVLRPVRELSSGAAFETPDMSCFTEFETDGSVEWLGERPGSVEGLAAEVISGGEIRLSWFYRTPYGEDPPNDFGIYYSTDPDITPGSPDATETYTVDGSYFADISLSDGVAYFFAITARTSAPVESHISATIGPYIADDTAPDAPSLLATTTF